MFLSLPVQLEVLARSLAAESAGKSIAASMAIMAITTKSSIKVNPMGFLFEVKQETTHSLLFIKSYLLNC